MSNRKWFGLVELRLSPEFRFAARERGKAAGRAEPLRIMNIPPSPTPERPVPPPAAHFFEFHGS